jgi:hypothetical protein
MSKVEAENCGSGSMEIVLLELPRVDTPSP